MFRSPEERLQFALDAARMGTWAWDPHADVATHDARALEILGGDASTDFSMEASRARHLPSKDASRYAECLRRITDPHSDSHVFEIELPWMRPDGSRVWVQFTGQARIEGEGAAARVTAVGGTVVDISQRKRNEEAIAEASRQKDRFLATLAHELRNPLAPMWYAVELLHSDGTHELEWARGVIDRQLAHLTRLIDDLLDLARITRDQLEIRADTIAMGDVVHAAIEASRPALRQHAQQIEVSLPTRPIHVEGDIVRLTQVFTNLLINAAKFATAPGTVWLTVELEGEKASVCVRDSGAGIPEHALPHLFDIFYQIDASSARRHGGLGIGLYLVRRIIELHGGTVEARNAPGGGADFIVTLPVVGASAEKEDERGGRAVGGSNVAGQRVLLVDDNRDGTDVLASLLRNRGASVATAYDGASGLAAADRFRPDVVLLDLGMPGIDGYEVCRRIRENPWGRAMRIVALTGWGRSEDRARNHAVGFDDHMVKPVSVRAVESLLARERGH